MESDRPLEEKQLLNALTGVMPLAREVPTQDRSVFMNFVRQWLRRNAEEQSRATSIYRPGDRHALRQLVDSLPWHSEEEIRRTLDDLQLTALERDLEAAHWAFRHQAAAGDFLVEDELVSFRLVRFQPTLYLLLTASERPGIIAGFNAVFSREPVACSGSALRAEGETWAGWVWETGDDPEAAHAALQRIREIWRASGA